MSRSIDRREQVLTELETRVTEMRVEANKSSALVQSLNAEVKRLKKRLVNDAKWRGRKRREIESLTREIDVMRCEAVAS